MQRFQQRSQQDQILLRPNIKRAGPPFDVQRPLHLGQNECENWDTVLQWFDHFRKGEVEGVVSLLDEAFMFNFGNTSDPRLPCSGSWDGRQGFVDFAKKFHDFVDLISLEPVKLVVMGDEVFALVDVHARAKATGKEWHALEVHDVELKGGKILAHSVFPNTLLISDCFNTSSNQTKSA